MENYECPKKKYSSLRFIVSRNSIKIRSSNEWKTIIMKYTYEIIKVKKLCKKPIRPPTVYGIYWINNGYLRGRLD